MDGAGGQGLMDTGLPFGVITLFRSYPEVMVAQHRQCSKCQSFTFYSGYCYAMYFHFNFFFFFKESIKLGIHFCLRLTMTLLYLTYGNLLEAVPPSLTCSPGCVYEGAAEAC